MTDSLAPQPDVEPIDYDHLVDMFNQALIHTLRKHSVADSYLDFWVPDSDPIVGIANMIDSARIAGLDQIVLRVGKKTVPANRVNELERALSTICALSLHMQGDSIVLRATGFRQPGTSYAASGSAEYKPRYWGPERAGAAGRPGSAPTAWDDSELPELGDIHPHFRSAVKAVLPDLTREGDLPVESGDDRVAVSGSQGAIVLRMAVDPKTHLVHAARHAGAVKPSERAVLDLFCRASERVPIQEVADHIALKVLESLVDRDRGFPVKGVLLPVNAGEAFALPARLARKAYNDYCTRTNSKSGTNFYHAPPSTAWQDLTAAQRMEKVDYVRRAFLQSEGLFPDDIDLLDVVKNKYGHFIRVIIGFSDRVEVVVKPGLMRRFEQRLRRDLEPEIDLVAARAKDTSPLRRLS